MQINATEMIRTNIHFAVLVFPSMSPPAFLFAISGDVLFEGIQKATVILTRRMFTSQATRRMHIYQMSSCCPSTGADAGNMTRDGGSKSRQIGPWFAFRSFFFFLSISFGPRLLLWSHFVRVLTIIGPRALHRRHEAADQPPSP